MTFFLGRRKIKFSNFAETKNLFNPTQCYKSLKINIITIKYIHIKNYKFFRKKKPVF
jgi:hypothetical protein